MLLKFHEMPWYLLSCKQQLSYAHMLNRLQHGAVLQMGPFGVLNFETLSAVMSHDIIFFYQLHNQNKFGNRNFLDDESNLYFVDGADSFYEIDDLFYF